MDRRFRVQGEREPYVRVEVAKYCVRSATPGTVTLERKTVSMSETSTTKPDKRHPQQQPTSESKTTKLVPTSSESESASNASTTITTTYIRPMSEATSHQATSPSSVAPATAATATTKHTSQQSSALVPTSTVAEHVAPRSPQASPHLSHKSPGPPHAALTTSSKQVAQRPTATTTSAATTPGTAWATPSATVTSHFVGGKRPLGEESPIIILTEYHDEDSQKQQENAQAGLSESILTKRTKRQELTEHELQKPDPSKQQVSTPLSSSIQGGRESTRGRPGVHFSVTGPKRDVTHVMQFFQEQEKSLQESFLSLPKKSQRKQRSPSPHVPQQAGIGLEHLDNLIKLMEQLTSLKDENSRLRKRCDYLESTKILLQAKQDLSFESSSSATGFMTLPSHRIRQIHHQPGQQHGGDHVVRLSSEPGPMAGGSASARIHRPRLSSADELDYLEMVDTSSDQRPKRSKSALNKRSFSTGSLEVPSELFSDENGGDSRKRIKSKSGRNIFGGKHSDSKQKSKSSKWARMKKVLTGQKLYEDLGTTIRSLRELGKSTHVRYSTSAVSSSLHDTDLTAPSCRVTCADQSVPDTAQDSVFVTRSPLSLPPTTEDVHRFGPRDAETDPDLTSDIWMGPADWWEEYEAQKDGGGGTSTNSDVSSVIEVTTMYLGTSKKEATLSSSLEPSTSTTSASSPMTTSTTSTTSASSPMTNSATSKSSVSSGMTTTPDTYLVVNSSSLPRRQSSPSLSGNDHTEEEDLLDNLTLVTESTRPLHKSSSCKSADLEMTKTGEFSKSAKSTDGRESRKFHRTAWGRVKDIIHTRKDSIKNKPKRDKSGIESEETSEIDMEGMMEEQWRSSSFGDGLLSRSTPKTSPVVIRQTSKSISESPPGATGFLKTGPGKVYAAIPAAGTSPGNIDMTALLAGSMSDEFSRKMQEWEQKRSRKSKCIRASMDDSEVGSLEVSHEFPIKTMDLRDLRGKVPDSASEGFSPEESNTSMEVLGAPSINVEEMQRRMTDSFSRKMLEWELLKFKGSPVPVRDASPEIEIKGSKGRKDERQKSKRSREDKEKEKLERQRERDKQKVEREQVKLEKEKLRIEKERLRALEREAKLEKLKGRLSQSEMDPGYKNPTMSPLAEYKVTSDFARKLHDWELMKGLSHDVSNSIYLEAKKMSIEHLRETGQQLDTLAKQEQTRFTLQGEGLEGGVPDEGKGTSASPPVPPLSLQAYWDSPEDTSPVEKYSAMSLGDDDMCTSVTEECLTKSHITTLERANSQLLGELQKKEMEYAAVQEEVTTVNEKLARVKDDHATEMARFHRELAQGEFTGPVKLEVGHLESTMGELEDKIKLMENFGEKLAMSMDSAAVGKWQSIEGEEAVHTQLVELVDQMRCMLIQATQSEEQSLKSSALSNFETLYNQAMKLQVQMNNLRLSHLERNREIMVIKRQLLLQEVNNLLLQADITRRETELYQFHEARRFASLKRWNTFGGTDRQRPQAQVDIGLAAAKSTRTKDTKVKPVEPRVNIPYIAEDVILASAASSSLSAPASPSAIAAAGGGTPMIISQSHSSSPAGSRELSPDHVEMHLLTPPTARGREWEIHHQLSTSSDESASKADQPQGQHITLKLPTSSLRIQTRTMSKEAPTSPSLTSSPYSSATPSPLSSPALLITPTSTGDTPDLSGARSPLLSPALPTTQTSPGETTGLSRVFSPHETDTAVLAERQQIKEPMKEQQEQDGKQSRKMSTLKHDYTTLCDSAPLHKEIETLKKAKSKVEKEPATLKKVEVKGPSPAPSPGRGPRQGSKHKTPDQFIPKQRSFDKPKLTKAAAIIDDDYSLALPVMECTDVPNLVEYTHTTCDSELGAVGGIYLLPLEADPRREQLPPTSEQARALLRSPRSPVNKHKLLRRQREERESKLIDYTAISPKGSPIAARGKPPLPRQVIATKQPPTSSPATEKGPRSKSVGDMEPVAPDSPSSKPLQDAINRFEKRATVCETEDRPIELRKTPSPTLHLPRVGLVSRVRRLKPAAELLKESQRFRSGHSIYATRIMQKYIKKDERKQSSISRATNKENMSGTYVQSIVQRLSRETTPVGSADSSQTNSNLSLQKTDKSPRAQSEFVSNIVRKLSTASSGRESPKSSIVPLKDLTNGGQVKHLTQAFNGHPCNGSPERTLSETKINEIHNVAHRGSSVKTHHRKSCEVAMVLSSSTSRTSEMSYEFVSSMSTEYDTSNRPGTTVRGPTNHKSLPVLATSEGAAEYVTHQMTRSRAATYCAPRQESEKQTDESTSYSSSREENGKKAKSKDKQSSKSRGRKEDAGRLPSSSLSPERPGTGRGKMGTVGVLCKQSISFDLGVSLYAQKTEGEISSQKSRKPRSWDPSESLRAEEAAAVEPDETFTSAQAGPSSSLAQGATTDEARPTSTSSEGEMAPSSPTTEEKKKSRRFLDSSWLQKSKKFFKVSK